MTDTYSAVTQTVSILSREVISNLNLSTQNLTFRLKMIEVPPVSYYNIIFIREGKKLPEAYKLAEDLATIYFTLITDDILNSGFLKVDYLEEIFLCAQSQGFL